MTEKRFSLVVSLAACVAAIEVAAFAICLGTLLLTNGPRGILEGISIWAIGQLFILPIAAIAAPFGALLRFILGLVFNRPLIVSMVTGLIVGGLIAAIATPPSGGDLTGWIALFSVFLPAGLLAGLTWWKIEDVFLGRCALI